MIPIHYHSFINFPWIGQALPRCPLRQFESHLGDRTLTGSDRRRLPWDFLEDHPISRVGIDVPTFGDLLNITFPYLLEMKSPLFSWVMWNIGTFNDIYQPLHLMVDMTGSPQSASMVVHGIFPKTNHFKWYPQWRAGNPHFFRWDDWIWGPFFGRSKQLRCVGWSSKRGFGMFGLCEFPFEKWWSLRGLRLLDSLVVSK